jgi:hypothetical protein
MSERLITALVVDAFLLFVGFESALGEWFRETHPTAAHIAVWLGVALCALGTWAYLRTPDTKTQLDKLRFWAFISFFIAFFVAFGLESARSPRNMAVGLFLLFAIGKIFYSIPSANR